MKRDFWKRLLAGAMSVSVALTNVPVQSFASETEYDFYAQDDADYDEYDASWDESGDAFLDEGDDSSWEDAELSYEDYDDDLDADAAEADGLFEDPDAFYDEALESEAAPEWTVSVSTDAKYAAADEVTEFRVTAENSFGETLQDGDEGTGYSIIALQDGEEIFSSDTFAETVEIIPVETGLAGELTVTVSLNNGEETATDEITLPCSSRLDEDTEVWDEAINDYELTDVWPEDLVAIAQTQIGYQESTENFIINEEDEVKGWTRYGAYYGLPYEDWCAMFVSFNLESALIPEEDFAREVHCQRWIEALDDQELYLPAEDVVWEEEEEQEAVEEEVLTASDEEASDAPDEEEAQDVPEEEQGGHVKIGDLVFFNYDGDEEVDHVGIVEDINYDEYKLYTIEGNIDASVVEMEYALDDASLAGFGLVNKAYEDYMAEEIPETEDYQVVEDAVKEFRAESEHYIVTVKTDANAVPEDAYLQVAELEEDTPEFVAAKEALVNDKEEIETVEDFDETYGFAALDVTFFVDDEEVEPEGAVSVSIVMKELPEDATAEQLAESMGITHLKEEEDGTVTVETVATTDGEDTEVVETIEDPEEIELESGTIQVAEEMVVAQFEVESFSTFPIWWINKNGGWEKADFTFVKFTGQSAQTGWFKSGDGSGLVKDGEGLTAAQEIDGIYYQRGNRNPVQVDGNWKLDGTHDFQDLPEGDVWWSWSSAFDRWTPQQYNNGGGRFWVNELHTTNFHSNDPNLIYAGTFVAHYDDNGNCTGVDEVWQNIWTVQSHLWGTDENGKSGSESRWAQVDPAQWSTNAVFYAVKTGRENDEKFEDFGDRDNGGRYVTDNTYNGNHRVAFTKNDKLFVTFVEKGTDKPVETVASAPEGFQLKIVDYGPPYDDYDNNHHYGIGWGGHYIDDDYYKYAGGTDNSGTYPAGASWPEGWSGVLGEDGYPYTAPGEYESEGHKNVSLGDIFENAVNVDNLFVKDYYDNNNGTFYYNSDEYSA